MQQPIRQSSPQPAPAIATVPSGPDAPVVASRELTAADVRAVRARNRDLRSELQDAAERRNSIAGRLAEADPGARPGYLARLQVLDTRILSIENEITRNVQLLGTAPTSATMAGTIELPGAAPIAAGIASDIVPIVAILSVFVLAPLTIAFSRFIWRRAVAAPPRQAISDHATQQRLESLQQAVDTIAIEVERISEGQRFVTRLLSDRALGSGEPPHLSTPPTKRQPGPVG